MNLMKGFSSDRQLKSSVIIILALFLLTGLVLYSRLFLLNLDKLPRGDIIPNGGEAYAVSQGPFTDGPKFKEVDITPRKVSLGDKQVLVVKMESPEEVASVKAVTELDSSIKEIVLERNENNEWRGEWIVEDTSTKTYRTTFIALGKDGKENRFTMAWTDPCSGIPLGGDGTLSADCTISGVDGVDNGNLNLNGRTITIPAGATFVWNSGKTITANGTIAVSGQLKKTYIWVQDVDNDGYGAGSTMTAQDTQPGGTYYRRYTRSGTNDCYDSNASAKPGQTEYFTSNRGDGSFDYDCSGSQDKESSLNCTAAYTSCSGYILYSGANVTPGFGGSVNCGQSATWYGLVEQHEDGSCTHWNAGPRTTLNSCGQSYNCPWWNPCVNLPLTTKTMTCR